MDNMKFSLRWLKEFIPVELSPNQLAAILTSAGLEVDAIESAPDISVDCSQACDTRSLKDHVFEISLTPNLGHCASMMGIARELSAANLGKVRIPKINLVENAEATASLIQVNVEELHLCPRYSCRVARDVVIGPSPEWMQERLKSAGIRPINNIVDITNYVVLESGQPLHAFDYDKLQGNVIVVRRAESGETLTTLDGQVRQLNEDDLLICDKATTTSSRPIALAGVMGGLDTEVNDATCNVLIESANFLPSSIRRTSRRLGLQTDASKRFERSVDPGGVLWALDRAAMLMQELAKGKISSKLIDIKVSDFPSRRVDCRLSRVNQLLGTILGVSELEDIFGRLEFIHHWDGKDLFELQIPTYRADITAEIDIVEEVARIYGYDNIPNVLPKYHGSELPHAPMFLFERKVRGRMLAKNLQEFLTCDLIGPTLLNIVKISSMPPEASIRVMNPTSIEQSILRTSLLPGLLQLIKYNHDHQSSNLRGFEIGRIHFKANNQYKEQSMLGIVMAGDADLAHWSNKSAKLDFYDLKGLIEFFLADMGINDPLFKISELNTFHPGRQQTIFVGDLKIGAFGELHPAIVKRLDIPERILFAEICLHDLYQMQTPEEKVKDLPLFPSSERDWTITVSNDRPLVEILDVIQSMPSDLLEEVTLIDIYESDKLGKGKRNATFHFVYRDKEKTIAQAAVDDEHRRIIEGINQQCHWS